MDSKKYYELLGIEADYAGDDLADLATRKYNRILADLISKRDAGEIDDDTLYQKKDELLEAKEALIKKASKANPTGAKKAEKAKSVAGNGLKKGIVCAAAVVVIGAITLTGFLGGCSKQNTIDQNQTGFESSSVEYEAGNTVSTEESVGKEETQGTESTESTESTEATEGQEEKEEEKAPEAVNYGDIMDEALVRERAATLVKELNEANVINPVTGVSYTEDEIYALILYSNGMYIPSTIEEIDVLHLNLLNLLVSPLNTDAYLFHVAYVTGNEDFKDLAVEYAKDMKPINFAGAFAEYGTNGVYPLSVWMQQQREAIYSTTDREEVERIYNEVGQVMADLMKGNGCTITVTIDGKENTYTFTSEQVLANHASAMLLTVDAQLIFANHYQIRDENNKIIDSVPEQWEVYNKFNSAEPDIVSLDEIQAWINNGCDYEWGIDSVLINGQTFGQRIQGDLEGMAQNNYAMTHGSQALTK